MFHLSGSTQRQLVFIITVILWLLSVSVVLHNQEIITTAWQRKPVTNFRHVSNYMYEVILGTNALSPPSASVVYEDGIALGPGNSNAPSISCFGRGRYQFRYDRLHFSASDNSDPRTNGRYYEIEWPFPIPPLLRWLVFGLTAAATVISYYYLRSHETWVSLGEVLKQHDRVLPAAAVLVPFLITRLPYFLYYPVISLYPDSVGYLTIVDSIDKGMLPSLYLRPPGYSLFMKLVFMISNKLFSVIIAQSALTLISSLVFVYAVFKTYRSLTVLSAIAMTAFISSHVHMEAEISVLSESVYVSVLVLAFGFLILALRLRKPGFFVLFSTAAAYAIYIRPAGIFFIVIVLLTLVYLITNRYKISNSIALTVPFASLLLMLAVYNLFTFNRFSLSNYGEFTVMAGLSIFMEQDDRYSKELNAAIKKIRDRSTPRDRVILETSWDIDKFDRAMFNAYNVGGDGGVIGPVSEAVGNPPQQILLGIFRGLYLDVIKKNPYQFFRKTFITFLAYHKNTSKEHEIYSIINMLYDDMYVQRNTLCNSPDAADKELCKEYITQLSLPYFSVQQSECGSIVNYKQTFIQRIHYKIFSKLHKALFRNLLWPVLNIVIFVMSAIYLVRSRLVHIGAFILFAMSFSAIASALIVGVSTFPNIRYSYTTEFIYYAGAALLPVLWHSNSKIAISPSPSEYHA
ncbi:MAG: hypothetical protein H7843_02700 [Nitrospirota bacterium]